ncbi:hypothetical protein PG994_007119 [Apiospora phragmitis]|uniref:Uncharacterized protein n=1 Tax=Apiospora phragmitis TaxID=2905665 RepID=A0ABR1UZY6_9PEZI
MQFTTTTTTTSSAVVLAALAGFPSLAAAVGCTRKLVGGVAAFQYTIFDVPGVTDPNGLCNGLRDNLHPFGQCAESQFDCRMVGNRFEWQLVVPDSCNNGMIASAWWEATKNNFGAIPKCTEILRRQPSMVTACWDCVRGTDWPILGVENCPAEGLIPVSPAI